MAPPPRSADAPRAVRLAWPIGLAVAAAVFALHLANGFVWDDAALVVGSPAVTGADPWRAVWTRDLFYAVGGTQASHVPFYRPVLGTVLRLLWAAGGGAAWPFHLASAALHLAAAALGLAVLVRAGVSRTVALAAATLFLVHPSVGEPVYWASSMSDPLFLVGLLLAVLAAAKAREALGPARAALLAASAVASALTVFAKETAVVVPALVTLEALAAPRSEWRARLPFAAPSWLPVPAYLAARAALLPPPALAFHALPGRLARAANALAWHLSRIVLPLPASPIHELGARPAALTAAVLLVAALAIAATARLRPGGPFLAGWIVLPLLPPLAQTFFAMDTGLSVTDRYVYPTLLPALAAAGTGAAWLLRRLAPARALPVLGASALLAFAAAAAITGELGRAYASDGALYARVLASYPRQPHALLAVGDAALARGDVEGALRLLRDAVDADPRVPVAQMKLGDALRKAGRDEEALARYGAAIALAPTLAEARLLRADLLAARGSTGAALSDLAFAAALEPANPQVRLGLGLLRASLGDLAGAVADWEAGAAGAPGPASCTLLLNLATGHVQLGHEEAAVAPGRRFVASCPGPEFADVRAQLEVWLRGR